MTEPKAPKPDVVLPFAPTDDGKGVRVLRARDDRVEAGEVRPVTEGQALHGELVRLSPREDTPALCDVEVLHDPRGAKAEERRSRPAQVATDAYREHWTHIFGESESAPPDPSKLN
jgi:hypothetical protein